MLPFFQAWRSWKNARSIALLAIAALAIGIGSTTAIYSVVQAVLLNPVPYASPDRYFSYHGAWRSHPGWWTSTSYLDSLYIASKSRTVETFGCAFTGSKNLAFNGQPLHVYGTYITPALLHSFGVAPLMGLLLEQQSNLPQTVISASLWKKLGSDPNVVGKRLTMDGEQYVIRGVMPGWFRYPIYERDNEVWMPIRPDNDRRNHYLQCVAKLKPGITQQQALQDLNRVQAELQQAYRSDAEPDFITLTSIVDWAVKDVRPSLLLLLAAAGALFLIAIANVASLFLARSVARARETAVRVALGASNAQLGLHYFSEGLLVSLAGAALGSLLSFGLVRTVLSIAADEIPRSEQIAFNWHVLGFALALAVFCGILFSISPLWQARHIAPNDVLSEGTRASVGTQSRNLLRFFVVAQIALTFGLITVGGLIFEQLRGLYRANPGFDPGHLTVVYVYAPEPKYRGEQARTGYEDRLREAVQSLPGVEKAGFIDLMPLTGWGNNTVVQIEGRRAQDLAHSEAIEQRFVTPEYFQTMKIPLLDGRFFNQTDTRGSVIPLLINQTMQTLYWPNQEAVGAYLRIFGHEGQRYQIIGVVGDVRNAGLSQPVRPEFYLSYRSDPPHRMAWVIRSNLDSGTLIPALRRAVERVDPEQTIFEGHTLHELVTNSISQQRLQSLMVTFFAGAALLLAVMGIYGVVSYAVRQRITEMGTRMAVGATPRGLLMLVLGDGFKMAGVGTAIGLTLVLALAHILSESSLKVQIHDPWPFVTAVLLIGSCTIFAGWFPAWRASTLPPMVAIRSDLHLSWSSVRQNYRILTERVSELLWLEHQEQSGGADLLAAIADASRQAESFAAAIESALQTLEVQLRASAVSLFTRREPDQPFCLTARAADEGLSPKCVLPADGLLLNRLRNYSLAFPISGPDLVALRSWAKEQAPEHLPEIDTLDNINARVASPLVSKLGMNGILILGPPIGRGEYNVGERKALKGAAAELALLIENGRLSERIVEQERLRRELMLATEVQRRLFPERPMETSSLQLTGICLPARGVGGDYYDFLDLGNRQIGIALADVAGKGIAAALLMSVVQASLRSLAGADGVSLAELAGKMNRLLHRSTGVSSYATFFYAQFDEERHSLRYVNAGHNPPFLLRKPAGQTIVPFAASATAIEELSAGGMIIGMFAQADYEETEIELHSGDILMAFSDGVTEAHDPNEDEFGEERLKESLRRASHLPINEMASKILQDLKTWMADAPQHDDLTFVLMRVV